MRLSSMSERQLWLALMAFCVLLYVPLAGNYGLWDPWETHYGEVARQMLARNDWVSLWWPGSPVDRVEFWSKPVLTFWILALSMKIFGFEHAGASPSELVSSWRVEWALRLPMIALSILTIWSLYELVRRLCGRRAALFSALMLATSTQWLLVTRQAMTDLPFVAPMTASLAFAGAALLGDDGEQLLARRRLGRFSWPHARSFYLFVILFALTTLPQLAFAVGRAPLAMLPYYFAFAVGLWWCAQARKRRQIFLFNAWVLAALATLAKGPAGIGLPAIVLALYLLVAGRPRDILFALEIPRGLLLWAASSFPWYHAMLLRHGAGFWNEFIGDNYVHRAQGRHGDRGSFDYYLEWGLYGTFPWSGAIAAGSLLAPRFLDGKRRRLGLFALVWVLSEFVVLTVVNTKFHHYVLPLLPALCILGGLFLDELLATGSRLHVAALALVGLPVTLLCARDLSMFPARLLWLFNYDYVVMPGTGRPWPEGFDYRAPLAVLGLLVVAALAFFAARRSFSPWLIAATLWSLFVADKFLVELSPHWSQKAVIASYYRERSGSEPLVVWQLYWRGENFYTRNQIFRSPDPAERSVFLYEGASDKLSRYLQLHPGRVFFLVERAKLESLRRELPESARAGLTVVDDSNNKLYLAIATL